MAVLGIETSCDDTGLALVENGRIIFSIKTGQEEFHKRFGGIVPEIASRRHLEVLPHMVQDLFNRISPERIKGIAVTKGPGLIGSLLVGVKFAEGLAMGLSVPLVGVDHLHGHIFSIFLEQKLGFPYISLLASGGHTALFLVKSYINIELLGETRDDACGEAFDKVAKMMDLGYPGGPVIERMAMKGRATIELPIPDLGETLDFSFSGLKTAVLHRMKDIEKEAFYDLAASFQKTVSEIFKEKIKKAVSLTGVKRIVFCGGVAANKTISQELKEFCLNLGCQFFVPSPYLCTDNGDMIAYLGEILLKLRGGDKLPIDVYSN